MSGSAAGPLAAPWTSGLRAITFDFGNTLVPVPHEDLARVVARTIELVLGPGAPEAERAAFLEVWAEERQRQFDEEVPALREVDLGQRFVRVFARRRGMPAPVPGERWDDALAAERSSPEEVAAAVDHYVESFVATLTVPPEVEPLLARLATRHRLAILSNWPVARAIDRFVEVAGWERWLVAIVVSQRVGTIKPDPAIFRAAEAALGDGCEDGPLAPGTILHVGDDWAADVVGAKRAGWRVAYLPGRQEGSPLPSSAPDASVAADLVLDDLAELEALA